MIFELENGQKTFGILKTIDALCLLFKIIDPECNKAHGSILLLKLSAEKFLSFSEKLRFELD